MIGAIAGDVIGSVYEWNNIKTKRFELFSPSCSFTDDSVLTVALADAILTNRDYVSVMKSYYLRYPDAGYGGFFHQWARSAHSPPYNSWGNGAAMRTAALGLWFLDQPGRICLQYSGGSLGQSEGVYRSNAQSS